VGLAFVAVMRTSFGMLNLRTATPADAALLLGFIRALAEYEREPNAVEVTEATLHEQLACKDPPFECLVAEIDGEAAGFALFFHSYSTWRGRRGIWLEDLFVLPDKRRHGVGRALLQRVAAIAVERDCARFEWNVLDWNEPAIAFYKSLGAKMMDQWTMCRVSDAPLQRLAAGG
jgi:GNAT superfamily N-acetyltransferase